MLRKISFPLFLLVLLSASMAFGATITLFQVSYTNSDTLVVWEVANEAGVQHYDLYRKANNEPTFAKITTISAASRVHYQYLDTDVDHSTANGNGSQGGPYTYRLTVRYMAGGQSYNSPLAQTSSAVQRSWVSIKSMFR